MAQPTVCGGLLMHRRRYMSIADARARMCLCDMRRGQAQLRGQVRPHELRVIKGNQEQKNQGVVRTRALTISSVQTLRMLSPSLASLCRAQKVHPA